MSQDKPYLSIVDVLRRRVDHSPNDLAYTFLSGGGHESEWLTYGELDCQARAVAALLQSYPRLNTALLLFPPGLEFLSAFLGCAYAGIISIPAPAPDGIRLKRTLPRLRSIARDAKPSVILCSARNQEIVENFCARVPEFTGTKIISITGYINDTGLGREWNPRKPSADDIVYLQYTSGSTSEPRGVIVTNTNLMSNLGCLSGAWGYPDNSASVTWMPHSHDYGLVEGHILPMYVGIPSYIMSSFAFVKQPIGWLQAISRYRATHSSAPPFAFDFCVNRTTPEQRAGLDLSCWKVASIGAERIREKTLRDFIDVYGMYGFQESSFYPAYGLAESTLMVSSKRPDVDPMILTVSGGEMDHGAIRLIDPESETCRRLVGCGTPGVNTKVLIVDPEKLTECLPGCIGEVWVTGPSVSVGYWNRPEETQETFGGYLADREEGPFLRTGDLGFIWKDELFITGRLKDLIIVRGVNHHAEDIEITAGASLAELVSRSGSAFSVDVKGEERLVVVQEMEWRLVSPDEMESIVKVVAKNIAERHDLQLYGLSFVKPGKLPRTTSGKVQRRACRQLWLTGELERFADWRADSQEEFEGHHAGSLFETREALTLHG